MQFLGNSIQGEISSQILGNILYGVFYNIIGNCMGVHTVFSGIFHDLGNSTFQGKNIPGFQKAFQIPKGNGLQLFFYQYTAADVINLGTDILGILGIGKTAFKLGKNMIGNRTGFLEIPVVQTAFNLIKIQ